MRKTAFLLIVTLIAANASGNQYGGVTAPDKPDWSTTIFCIQNPTNVAHIINAINIDSYDWVGNNRPDINMQNITIQPGEQMCRLEHVNSASNPAFDILVDGNPSRFEWGWNRYFPGLPLPTHKTWAAFKNPNNPTELVGTEPSFDSYQGIWIARGYGAKMTDEDCNIAIFRIKQ